MWEQRKKSVTAKDIVDGETELTATAGKKEDMVDGETVLTATAGKKEDMVDEEMLFFDAEDMSEIKEKDGQEQIWRNLLSFKETIGDDAFRRLVVVDMLDTQRLSAAGESLFPEHNSIDSLQRVKALEGRLDVLNAELVKSVKVWYDNMIHKGKSKRPIETNSYAVKLALFGKECEQLFSNEWDVLIDECAKATAELCVKKMQHGALVHGCEKWTTLHDEITQSRNATQGLLKKLNAFKRSSMGLKLTNQEPQSHAHAIVQEKDVRGAVMGDKCNMSRNASFGEKLRETIKLKGSALSKESYRVLMEMMKGVKTGCEGLSAPGVDEAIALADQWSRCKFDECVMKMCVAVFVDGRRMNETLRSEIVEAWKEVEKVNDGLAIHQRESGHAPAVEREHNWGWQKMGILVLFLASCVFAGDGLVKGFAKGKTKKR